MARNLRFGAYTFDPAAGILSVEGRPSLLGSRSAALLGHLLEYAGRPVPKASLIDRAWGGLAVEDSNLTVQIAAIRNALREAGQANWIETLPRRGYRYAGPDVITEEGGDPVPALASGPSIAILPFTNQSPDETPEYFIEGMVDDIITGLCRIKWLTVTGRLSSFQFQEGQFDARTVRQELGVQYVLLGNLRKLGSRVRLGAHLIDTVSGAQVWAQRFERSDDDLFVLQDEVALAVLAALEPGLRSAEVTRVTRQRPSNLTAYDLVLRSQADVFSGMPERSTRALPLLEEALKLEPDYALAHGYAAMAYHNRFLRAGVHEQDRLQAVRHARAAIQLGQDDSLALALGAFSLAMDDHDVAGAVPAFETAVEVSPSTALAYILGSVVHGWAGNPDTAEEFASKGLRLSPLDPWRFAAWHGRMLGRLRQGQFADALEAAYRSVSSNPGHSISYALLAAAHVRCGRQKEAKAAAARVLELQPTFSSRTHLEAVNCESCLAADLAAAFTAAGLPN